MQQTKTTRIQERRNAAVAAMQQVMEATGVTRMQYCRMMYASGLTYLEHFVRIPEDVARFERSRLFWNWWKIQWTIREEEFLGYVLGHPYHMRHFLWCKLHDPLLLAQERTPNGIILGDSWCVLIGKMRDDEAEKDRHRAAGEEILKGVIGGEE